MSANDFLRGATLDDVMPFGQRGHWGSKAHIERLNTLVVDLLKQHKGGEKFFDAFDASLRVARNSSIIDFFREQVILPHMGKTPCVFIVTGQFGQVYKNMFPNDNIVHVRGGLRKKGFREGEINYLTERLEGREVVFIDDSFYSGKTFLSIKEEVVKMRGRIYPVIFSIYDGSKDWHGEEVVSMFRYYK